MALLTTCPVCHEFGLRISEHERLTLYSCPNGCTGRAIAFAIGHRLPPEDDQRRDVEETSR
ncbi:MAG TPA: hypothetical protein VMX54_04505 [Vicinamibacteria bacterium]|nr:hypothetical protein [Vicinamibacteria bacterium]